MRTALYIRVSTAEQVEEGFSISAQKDRLTSFVHSQGWDVMDYYIDEGISAKDTDRPELKRLLDDVSKDKIDIILVYKLDRLTRSVTDLYKLLEHFDKHKAAFRSATEVYDTSTAMGRLFITLVAALAQWERENLAERVRVGMHQMVKEGRWHGGKVPYGFAWNQGDTLEIVESEALVVKKIFDYYISGNGDHKIAGMLNRSGYKTRNGNDWLGKGIRDILQNPVYKGAIRYMDEVYEGFAPSILSEGVFEQATASRKSRQSVHPRRLASTYIFSGVAKCDRCGGLLNGKASYGGKEKNYDYNYYICVNKLTGACDLPLLNQDAIEEQFLKEIKTLADDRMSYEVVSESDVDLQDIQGEIREVRKSFEAIKSRRKKWQIAFANGAIDLNDLKELTKDDNQAMDELKMREDELTKSLKKENKSPEEISLIISDFIENWTEYTPEEKKSYLRILVSEIKIEADSFRPNQYRKRQIYIPVINFN